MIQQNSKKQLSTIKKVCQIQSKTFYKETKLQKSQILIVSLPKTRQDFKNQTILQYCSPRQNRHRIRKQKAYPNYATRGGLENKLSRSRRNPKRRILKSGGRKGSVEGMVNAQTVTALMQLRGQADRVWLAN